MADTRHQADATGITLSNKEKNTLTVTGCEVTSVTQSSDGVYIEVSGDPCDFTGDVYVHVGGTKVKQSSIERMRRRERQKARQSAAISDAEREARREAQHQEWQARQERQRKETERRWEEREKRKGRKLTKAEHTAKDLEEENASRKKKSQRALTSFFKPVVGHVSQNVDCNETRDEEETDVPVVEARTTERVEERHEEDCAGKKASAFTPGMEVFLRLAFIDSEQVDSMMSKEAKKYIREKGIIGKVIIEEMVERDVARLNLVEFDKLRDFSKRSAGVDVHASFFSTLTEALEKVGGKVNTKYLTKQNRQSGENHKWTDTQIEQVRKAVEEAKQRWPNSLYSKAALSLRSRYNGRILGSISSQQVRNVYEQKVLKSNVPKAPVGRPRKKKSSQAAQHASSSS